jgi:hypothetical protein
MESQRVCSDTQCHNWEYAFRMAKIFDSDRGIRRSSYYDDTELTATMVDELIVKAFNRGWSQSQIARYLKNRGAQPATQQGVSRALRRIAAGRVGAGPRG